MDQPVIEDVVVAHPLCGVIGRSCVFEQDARLQPRPLVLTDPRELQSLLSLAMTSSTIGLTRLRRASTAS